MRLTKIGDERLTGTGVDRRLCKVGDFTQTPGPAHRPPAGDSAISHKRRSRDPNQPLVADCGGGTLHKELLAGLANIFV